MSIVTISRGVYSRGWEIAEKLARDLCYSCVSREIFEDAARWFHVPASRLVRAVDEAPTLLRRFTHETDRYLSYFRAALLKRVQQDNVVYHGRAGHFFLQGVPHALKIRIVADVEDRIGERMRRERLTAEQSQRTIAEMDAERSRWSLSLYGVDTEDSGLYDMVVHIKRLDVRDAVDIIKYTLEKPVFRTTPRSQRALNNMALRAQVEAVLAKRFHHVRVCTKDGEVMVDVGGFINQHARHAIERMVYRVPGVNMVTVQALPS
jgi:cytidylate kinase